MTHLLYELACNPKQPTHESFKILHDPEDRMWSAYDVRTVSDDDIRLLGRERGTIQGIVAGFPCQALGGVA